MVTTLVAMLAHVARHFAYARFVIHWDRVRRQVKGDLGGRDNAITRIRGDLIVRLSTGELAGMRACLPDRAGF
jgi:hypothetical protein